MDTFDAETSNRRPPVRSWRTFLFFAMLAGWILILPTPETFHKDEGGYLLALEHILGGRWDILFDKLTTPTLPVLLPAAPLYALTGESLDAVRLLIALLSFLCLVAFHSLGVRFGLTRPQAAAACLFLAVNPIFYRYTQIFCGDIGFLLWVLLALLFYGSYLTAGRKIHLLLGALFATLGVYTRQFGMILPGIAAALLLEKAWRNRSRPDWSEILLVCLPVVAFVPLGLYFRARYGSFLVPTVGIAPTHHTFGVQPLNILWCVNFLGLFLIPFLPWLLRRHAALLRKPALPAVLGVLSLSVFFSKVTVVSLQGGLGKIFLKVPFLPPLFPVLLILSQFLGLALLVLLVDLGWRQQRLAAKILLWFTLAYMAVLCMKTGYLLVHYALPFMLPVCYVIGDALAPESRWQRRGYGALAVLFALFSYTWALSEQATADASFLAVKKVQELARPDDRIFCLSSTALWHFNEGLMTARAEDSRFIIHSLDAPVRFRAPDGFRLLDAYPVELYGLVSLGEVRLFIKEEGR